MNSTRGLTLLEVLAATVLLAVLAMACLPILEQMARVTERGPPEFIHDLAELQAFADEFIENPSLHVAQPLEEIGRVHRRIHDDTHFGATFDRDVVIRRFERGVNGDVDDDQYTWVLFTCDDRFVLRWVDIDDAEQKSE